MKYLYIGIGVLILAALAYFFCREPKQPESKTPMKLPPVTEDEAVIIDMPSNGSNGSVIMDPNNVVGPIDRPNEGTTPSEPITATPIIRTGSGTQGNPIIETTVIRSEIGTQGNPIIDTNPTSR